MPDQPDIQVTDGAASPPGYVTVTVDGHSEIVQAGEPAAEFIRQAYQDAK